jgi:hypothetical protein
MPSVSAKTTVKSNLRTEVQTVSGMWTGGGAAANCTLAAGDHSAGITSVAYNAATGKYLITVSEWGQQLLPGSQVVIHRAAADAPLVANLIRTVTVATGGASATVAFEVWDLATPSLTDVATTAKVGIHLVFGKTKAV